MRESDGSGTALLVFVAIRKRNWHYGWGVTPSTRHLANLKVADEIIKEQNLRIKAFLCVALVGCSRRASAYLTECQNCYQLEEACRVEFGKVVCFEEKLFFRSPCFIRTCGK